MKTTRILIRNGTVIALFQVLGILSAAGAQTFTTPRLSSAGPRFGPLPAPRLSGWGEGGRSSIEPTIPSSSMVRYYLAPCRYRAELEADRREITARHEKITGQEDELKRLTQDFQVDAEALKSTLQSYKLEYQQEVSPYLTKLAQVEELKRQRRAELEAELARIPLNPYEPPPQYNAKVYWRNNARLRYQKDISDTESAIRNLQAEIAAKAAASRSRLQTVERAYTEAFQARKRVYDAKRTEYQSALNVANQFIDSYNSKLERYGTPVPNPAVQLTGTELFP